MELTNFTNKQLMDELERRRKLRLNKPNLVEQPDLQPLINLCEKYLGELEARGYAHEDFKNYIYEAAMEVLYGKYVWTFINSKR